MVRAKEEMTMMILISMMTMMILMTMLTSIRLVWARTCLDRN